MTSRILLGLLGLLAALVSASRAAEVTVSEGADAPGIIESAPAPPPSAAAPSLEAPGIIEGLPEREAPTGDTGLDPAADPLGHAMANMTLQQKVSQLMVVTMGGTVQPTAQDLAFLKSYTPGAAIIPKLLQPDSAAVYSAKLKGVQQLSGVPLWVGTNLYRLGRNERDELSTFIQLPSPLSMAAANDADTTRAVAELMAEHLVAMGFNLHLGPSLELAPTLPSAEGSIYTFGSDPKFIGDAYEITRSVFEAHGVLAVPLGFPGGGANRQRKSSAVLLTPEANLRELDLAPYLRAIAAKAPVLHVGNTLVPTIDPSSMPACVSGPVLRGLLREQLGYEGIVLAGPMDSQDVAGVMDPVDAAILALRFGADMLYWNGASNTEMRAIDKIVHAVHEERLDEARIDEALRRILTWKFAHLAAGAPALKEKSGGSLDKRKNLVNRVRAAERRAITVAQNNGGILPLTKGGSMPIGVTGTVGVEILTQALERHIKPISQQPITTARHIGEIKDFEINRVTSHIRGIKTVVCVFTDTDNPEGQVRLVQALQEKGVRVVVVLLGYPRNLPYLAVADAVVLAYCDPVKVDETVAAMGGILVGDAPVGFRDVSRDVTINQGEKRTFNAYDFVRMPAGRLPISLSERFPVGTSAPYSTEAALKKVEWDFGDGTRSKEARASHSYGGAGRYPVTLSVTTEAGGTSNYTFHVVVR